MARYRVEQDSYGDMSRHSIVNDESGESAVIVDGYGASLQSLRLRTPPGDLVDAVMGHVTPEYLRERPARGGAAILFPFANRVRLGRYRFMGEDHQLPVPQPDGHASHGFAARAPWRVTGKEATDGKGSITCAFTISESDYPGYPFRIKVKAVFTLTCDGFTNEITALNTGSRPLPLTMGVHPYLRVSQSADGRVDDWELTLPARKALVTEDMIPTGEVRDVAGTSLDFSHGRQVGGEAMDQGFTGLSFSDGKAKSTLHDPRTGLKVEIWQSTSLGYLQVYAPPSRAGLAVEPMSGAADAFNNGLGLSVLAPGEGLSVAYGIRIIS